MKANRRRVVITGMGVVSPLGMTVDSLWQALCERRSGVGPLRSLPLESLPVSYGGEIFEFDGKISDFGPLDKEQSKTIRKAVRMMCRECQMGVAAAQRALTEARIVAETVDPLRIGVSFNSDYMVTLPEDLAGAIHHCRGESGRFDFSQWAPKGHLQMNPLWQLKYLPNMPAAHLAIFNELRGPNNSITLREAGVGATLGEAFHIIGQGRADVMVVGGTGTRLHPIKTLHAAQSEHLATAECDPTQASRPFDRDRIGMVPGEGAAALVVEDLEHAQARGARIHAELLSGVCCAALDSRGHARRKLAMVNAIRASLHMAAVESEEIGHVNAHGLATHTCDIEEAEAMIEAFSDREKRLPVVAAKSYFGNLGGGGGFVELIASVEALKQQQLFATLNYRTPDPACPIHVAREDESPGSCFLKLSVSPQGQASAAVIAAFSEA